MSYGKTNAVPPVLALLSFLLWNRATHVLYSSATVAFRVFSFRWKATRERYEMSLKGQSSIPMSMPGLSNIRAIGFLEAAIGIIIVIFVIAALVGPVANFTTGITIAHTGFTPNPNVTASPGATPLLQLYPLFFVIFGLLIIVGYVTAKQHGSLA
jgi:hypothetical protein